MVNDLSKFYGNNISVKNPKCYQTGKSKLNFKESQFRVKHEKNI
jgi:hypothetical protein